MITEPELAVAIDTINNHLDAGEEAQAIDCARELVRATPQPFELMKDFAPLVRKAYIDTMARLRPVLSKHRVGY